MPSFLVRTEDDVEFKLNMEQVNKIKLFRNLYKATGANSIRIKLSAYDFAFIFKFLTTVDKTNLVVEIDKEYSHRDIYFPPGDHESLNDLTMNEIIRLAESCNYLEYSYLLELTAKKLSLMLMGTNGIDEFRRENRRNKQTQDRDI